MAWGTAYIKLKQFEKAIQDYNQAIELDPEYAHAFNNRGLAYADLEQFEKAIQLWV
jgi:tetratricopeptide (TPR) repeat protein